MPDLKYAEDDLAKKYSKIDNYFEIVTKGNRGRYEAAEGCHHCQNGEKLQSHLPAGWGELYRHLQSDTDPWYRQG